MSDEATTPDPRKPYETPKLVTYGDLTALTKSLKNQGNKLDGHPGYGMNKTY